MAKTKALISFAVTAKLICVFVFAYAKIRFSHDAAHMTGSLTVASLEQVARQLSSNGLKLMSVTKSENCKTKKIKRSFRVL